MQLFSTCAFVINIIAKTDVSKITNNILWLQHYVRQLQKSVYHTRHHSITKQGVHYVADHNYIFIGLFDCLFAHSIGKQNLLALTKMLWASFRFTIINCQPQCSRNMVAIHQVISSYFSIL